MKLYKVTAKHCGYYQYDCFVVWANSAVEAKSLAIEKVSDEHWGDNNFLDADLIEVIKPDEPEILLGSFIAG